MTKQSVPGVAAILLLRLKERLLHSPQLFELSDPTDEHWQWDDAGWRYVGSFAPAGCFSAVLDLTLEPDETEARFNAFLTLKARTAKHDSPDADIELCQRFTNELLSCLHSTLGPGNDISLFSYRPFDVQINLRPKPQPDAKGTLEVSEVQIPGMIVFETTMGEDEATLAQIDRCVTRLCDFWLSWDLLLEKHFGMGFLPPDEIGIARMDAATGKAIRLESVVPPPQYRRPPAYRRLYFQGLQDALDGKPDASRDTAETRLWRRYGPQAVDAYRAGFSHAQTHQQGEGERI